MRCGRTGRAAFIGWSSAVAGWDTRTRLAAREMGDFIAALGVPKDSITLEERSLTTRQNALFTAAIVQGWPGKKVLLTSDCHMRRARAAFARAGVETSPAPIPDIGKRWYDLMLRWDCIWTVGFETVKYVYYDLHGWI